LAELERESILALDNIRLDLPVAGVGGRCLAGLIDYACVLLLDLLWLLLCSALALWVKGTWALALMVAGWFAIDACYFAILETATGGLTLGKMALHLRVVTAEGAQPGPGAFLIRNLVRLPDYFVAVPMMALDPLSRRLGDRLAGTLVVHDRQAERPPPLLGRVPPGWGPREVGVVEGFLARERDLADAIARDEMARQLLSRIGHDAPELLAGIDLHDPPGGPVGALRRALQVREG
jgi:uncharacterized RDD family membrane protein YckC